MSRERRGRSVIRRWLDQRRNDTAEETIRTESNALLDLREHAVKEICRNNRLGIQIDELGKQGKSALEPDLVPGPEMERLNGLKLESDVRVEKIRAEIHEAELALRHKIIENPLAQVPTERREEAKQLLLEEREALHDLAKAAVSSEWAAANTFFMAVEDCWKMAVSSGNQELIDAQFSRLEAARAKKERLDLAHTEHETRILAIRDEYKAKLDRLKEH